MPIVVLDGHTMNSGDLSWDELLQLGEVTLHPRTSPAELLPRLQGMDAALTNERSSTAESI